jgi:hypothetical protein
VPVLTASRPRSSAPVRRFAPAVVAALLAAVCAPVVSPPSPAAAYPLNRCAPTENGLPVLEAVSVTQNVDVRSAAGRVRIAATAYDTGGPGVRTGLRAVRVDVGAYGVADLKYTGGHRWVGYLTIPRWSPNGTAVLASVQLTDRADFPYRSYDDEFDPRQPDVTYQPGGERRWSQVTADRTFKVVSTPDATVPQITALDFTPRTVDTRQAPAVVTLTAQATDDVSGVSGIEAAFSGPDVDFYRAPTTTALTPVAGSPGRFTGRWTVPRNAGTGDWSLLSVVVRDRAGNARSLGAPELVKAGWPRVLHVVSDPEPAMAEPTVVSVTASTTTVDVRAADTSVTYRLRAVNPVAPLPPGNAVVGLNLPQPQRSWVAFSTPRLVSGNLHDGVWEIVATVDSCVALPGTLTPTVTPGDGMTAPPVQVLAGDNTTPTLTARMSGNKVVVTFSEDVNGVSRYPLAVLRKNGLDYEKVPGSWSCGAGVSCVAGPVRTATYTPTATGAVLLRANPTGHLEVTDRAGNPAHQQVALVP